MGLVEERVPLTPELHDLGLEGGDPLVPLADEAEEQIFAEIYICPEVAASYARRHRQSPSRELVLYAVHGLLHLAGHEDDTAERRAVMEEAQEIIVAALWTDELAGRLA